MGKQSLAVGLNQSRYLNMNTDNEMVLSNTFS